MPRLSAHNVRVGIKRSCFKWSDKYVVLDLDGHEPITFEMDDAILIHRRLGTFVNAHTTAKRRANAVRR